MPLKKGRGEHREIERTANVLSMLYIYIFAFHPDLYTRRLRDDKLLFFFFKARKKTIIVSLSRTISSNTFWNIDCRSRRRRPRSICRPANGASTRGSVRAPPFQSSALRSLPRYLLYVRARSHSDRTIRN